MTLFYVKRLGLLVSIFIINILFVVSQNNYGIIDKTVKFGFRSAENRTINTIIVHSTFNNTGGEKYDIDLVIKQFSQYGVSSHYVIARDGSIYLLVNEKNVAFHAGKSQLPNGQSGVNRVSIGIEIMTSFEEAPTEEQIHALVVLVKDIKNRYKIEFLLRHSDIAPARKTDPWNLDWKGFLKRIEKTKSE